ncbi:hypothetical protein ACTNDZ_14385 [Selenomonas montiformis]|uniref:hypothetical protein n=1 Tax=Selenomonas montiformis TaxID=2652285 RepID=UPI003F8C2672
MKKYVNYMNPGNYGWDYTTWVKIGDVVIKLDEITYARRDGADVKVVFYNGSSTWLRNMTIEEFWNIVCKTCKAEKTDLPNN